DEMGLFPAMDWQIEDYRQRSGLSYRFSCEPEELAVEPDLATAVFRSFQELMVNVLRHADATQVDIRLERKACALELVVKDDGRGLADLDFRSHNSFGLLQVQERVKYWGGTMSIESSQGGGTAVVLNFPLDPL
ncbi:MAG: sensor histidine kinase, partial [Acidobacteria bacterium]|nr:sensor histidine kinase [Acidobacteriota bacterium]